MKRTILKIIQKLGFGPDILSALLHEGANHAAEQKKQAAIFNYVGHVIKRGKLNKSYLLNALIDVTDQNKSELHLPKLAAISNDYIGMRILVEGYFEKDLLEFLGKKVFCRDEVKHGIALDVGAFIGTHTLYMAGFFKQILSFEPNPYMYKILDANIQAAGALNVVPLNYGLTRIEETLGYYKYEGGNEGMNKFVRNGEEINPDEKLVKIGDLVLKNGSAAVLDFFHKQNLSDAAITLIKIDTEGFEMDVLMGLSEILTKHKAIVLFESTGIKKTTNIINLLKGAGYNQFVELQEYLPIIPIPVIIQDKFYPLILASKTTINFSS